jgi:integrase
LENIKHEYYLRMGLIDVKAETFETVFRAFITKMKPEWRESTLTKVNTTFMHLQEFEKKIEKIDLQKINIETWDKLKNEYFVTETKFSNSTINKYLSFFKQFLRFAKRAGYITHEIDFEEMEYLEEIEPFKIALKINEVETLIKLNLENDKRLERVRDLFYLEIMTGQRFSDIPKLLDKNNITEKSVSIYQEKTNEKVNIPLHPKLKTHLEYIFDKYPEGLPVITNQKFNEYLKEICGLAKFNQKHSWITISGKTKTTHSDFRYNLISSHTGRRTFCTLALKNKIDSEEIMKVTGHRKYDQFREYVKVDDEDVNEAFKKF